MQQGLPLATSSWDDAEYAAIQRVIASDRFSMGEEVAAFENQFAEHFGSRFAVMVNSGSSANLLMIAALRYTANMENRLDPGSEVIVPAVSWSTTYYPLYQYGLKMKFVDIDRNTLNYDLDALRAAVTSSTRAIMVVNLLGNPNDFAAINALASEHKLVLLEDNCESMGAQFEGRMTGTFGLAGTFSTFFSHHISTMEGGVVVTDDEELYHIMLSLRAHGWTRNLPWENRVTGRKSDEPFDELFRFVLPGYNLRPLEMSGAIGREQLKKLPNLIAGRRANAEYFVKKMRNHPYFAIQEEIGESSWFGFSLVVREGCPKSRQVIVAELTNMGFECRPIVAGNFAKNKVVEFFDHKVHDDLRNAEYIDGNGFFIGNHHYPIDNAIDALASFSS